MGWPTPNQTLHLTAATISVSRSITSLQAALASEHHRSQQPGLAASARTQMK
jgi:hypothetical protein